MVTIRLARHGAKKRPFYQIVATDSRNARDGRNLEKLGYFNPVAKGDEHRLFMDLPRVEYWISVGAQPSERVSTLIKEAKAMPSMEPQKPKRLVRIVKPKPIIDVTAAPAKAAKKPAKKASGDKKPAAKKPVAKKAPVKAKAE
jgi:small subunit ribosomal protein S16